jgi:glucose uptake protein GlcU
VPLLSFGAVTVVTMAVLTKAYNTDLAPTIAWFWVVYALYAFGLRVHHAEAVSAFILSLLGGLAHWFGTVL